MASPSFDTNAFDTNAFDTSAFDLAESVVTPARTPRYTAQQPRRTTQASQPTRTYTITQ